MAQPSVKLRFDFVLSNVTNVEARTSHALQSRDSKIGDKNGDLSQSSVKKDIIATQYVQCGFTFGTE